MFRKVLVANRGEIALRVIRSLRELGIKSVAVYSEADIKSLHVIEADETYLIGEPPPSRSYLDQKKLISIARSAGCDAVHPGYGFLSENAEFRRLCDENGIVFIGPPAEAIRLMGEKTLARKTMKAAGVPVVPGTMGACRDKKEAVREAREIGYPVMIKACAGGGGKGMRIVNDDEECARGFESAGREALASFGDPSLYLEKYIENPRHIEIQLLADRYGNGVYLFERECSVQRRHQKIIEEAPACNLPEEVVRRMGEIAVSGALSIGYECAGTCEFLVDGSNNFYFLEMNTRLQVEHPVTEMTTGFDIVKYQIITAAGEKLDIRQEEIERHGHAIECRIYAEDPFNNFLPSPGIVTGYKAPSGPFVRVDDYLFSGAEIPRFYDSMIAKLIIWGRDRKEAISRMKRALSEYRISGVRHNIPFLLHILEQSEFADGRYDTGILGRIPPLSETDSVGIPAIAAALYTKARRRQQKNASVTGGANTISFWRTAFRNDRETTGWR